MARPLPSVDTRSTPSFPTDVDECSTGEASCPQRCVNTVGSYWCQCWEGQSPSADGMHCLPKEGPSLVAPNPTTGNLAFPPCCDRLGWLLGFERRSVVELSVGDTEGS